MKILITGANGFVGTSLTAHLEKLGNSIIKVSRQSHGDINLITNWEQILKDHGIDTVIHLAAVVHQMNQGLELDDYKKTNIDTTERIAKASVACNVKTFIFLSSIKVNGEESALQYNSNSIPSPIDPYGQSKLQAEEILDRLAKDSKTSFISLRPPLIYGRSVKANMLKLVNLVKRGAPLPLGAINNQRSLLYLGNLISAIETIILSKERKLGENFVYLISDNDDCSTSSLIRDLATVLNKRVLFISLPSPILKLAFLFLRRHEQYKRIAHSLFLDPSKFMNDFNWSPPYSRKEGLRHSFQEHIDFQDK